jgi:hypothetical protein
MTFHQDRSFFKLQHNCLMIFLDPELSVFPAVTIISLLFFTLFFIYSMHTNYRTFVCRIIYLHSIRSYFWAYFHFIVFSESFP